MSLSTSTLSVLFVLCVSCFRLVASQTAMSDFYTTTWNGANGQNLFEYQSLVDAVTFAEDVSTGTGSTNIVLNPSQTYQTMEGFGASLTDSSANLLMQLKQTNAGNYWNLLTTLFNAADGQHDAGFSYIRVPLGSTDFSLGDYTLDDVDGDVGLSKFSPANISTNTLTVLHDIQGINNLLKVHILPWSMPPWMKTSGSTNGGNLLDAYISVYSQYLYKSVQAFADQGLKPYAISVQNEPENNNPTYPSAIVTPQQSAQIAVALKTLLKQGQFDTRIFAEEHNWDQAETYAIPSIQDANGAFDAVSFHCYSGDVSGQDVITQQYPNLGIALTECTGELGSDWWSDIKWNMDTLMIGSVEHGSQIVGLWNLALDAQGGPELPGSNSCNGGVGAACRGVVTINPDGSYVLNQEFYALAHASKAIVPKDAGGPFGQRIDVQVQGDQASELVVSAFKTGRANAGDWERISLVALNWNDGGDSAWNPQSVPATIGIGNSTASYTFPVGVTTLFFYVPPTNANANTKRDNLSLHRRRSKTNRSRY